VDWGEVASADELEERTHAALRTRAEPWVPPDEVHELRMVSTWIAANDPPTLDLGDPPTRERLKSLLPATDLRVPTGV
jgi:hypothetical protein